MPYLKLIPKILEAAQNVAGVRELAGLCRDELRWPAALQEPRVRVHPMQIQDGHSQSLAHSFPSTRHEGYGSKAPITHP
eukprot:CAMPEP_0171104464 /NCGR_PEP_ID=MMETSP0766_2-20121228/60693_1 /TAXON_ID=439317 /ORGANISM="Gambierdiscus australes, Strain CAWD 149" /LENGTH=78 /DNA_ID=CAMNT_0011565099 /DNA_START=58 /DNA_END=291 /DNA_ORIENTATION=-